LHRRVKSIDGTKAQLTEQPFSERPPSRTIGTWQRPVLAFRPLGTVRDEIGITSRTVLASIVFSATTAPIGTVGRVVRVDPVHAVVTADEQLQLAIRDLSGAQELLIPLGRSPVVLNQSLPFAAASRRRPG
jgi:hypothetical protein